MSRSKDWRAPSEEAWSEGPRGMQGVAKEQRQQPAREKKQEVKSGVGWGRGGRSRMRGVRREWEDLGSESSAPVRTAYISAVLHTVSKCVTEAT